MIVQGNAIAQTIRRRLRQEIEQSGLKPHLAVVLVGQDPASETYVRKKQAAAQEVGVKFSLFKFPSNIDTARLCRELAAIQQDRTLTGIIVQLPLPAGLDKPQVLNALRPELDVDYLSWVSLGKLVIGENPLVPPT